MWGDLLWLGGGGKEGEEPQSGLLDGSSSEGSGLGRGGERRGGPASKAPALPGNGMAGASPARLLGNRQAGPAAAQGWQLGP